jgi:peptidoglycan-N-acetylglucosamine deacetylase
METPPNTPSPNETPPRPAAPLPLFWRLLESWFRRTYHIEPVDDRPDGLLAYNLYVYRGPEVRLQDGEVVRDGDQVMEMHFRREALLPLIADGNPRRMGIALLRLGDRDFPKVGLLLEEDPRLAEVRAVHALTLFHRGIQRFGFEVVPVREWWAERWFTWYHRMLMARDHAHGRAHVRANQEKLVTRHIWISRAEMIHRYGRAGTRREREPQIHTDKHR